MDVIRPGTIYYGDNLGWLRRFPDTSVDLVYLDPPFNANRNFNVLFKDESGIDSAAQRQAFEDTWHWGADAAAKLAFLTETARHGGAVPDSVGVLVRALHQALGTSQMMAYITQMTIRLVEMHRLLKPTGALFLHCDPIASHHLRLMLDAIFGPGQFRNEIVWKRSDAHNDAKQGMKRFGRIHDVLLFYSKTDAYHFDTQYTPLPEKTVKGWYRHQEPDGRRYNLDNATAAKPGGDTLYEFQGIRPPEGRFWAYSRANMERLNAEGRLVITPTGKIYVKRYLDESRGVALQDIWADVGHLRGFTKSTERLGWPTQKPRALLERIIDAAAPPDGLVLDPFCGCGTAIDAAESRGRKWVGVDNSWHAIEIMQARMRARHGLKVPIEGAPTELEGARALALERPDGREQFEAWALSLVGAIPHGGPQKKGADRGADGVITFGGSRAPGRVIVSVKSGARIDASDVRELRGAMERHQGTLGLFVTLEEPTRPMREEAASAGVYSSPVDDIDYPRVQIVTIRQLLEQGHRPALPPLVSDDYGATLWSEAEVPRVPKRAGRRRPRAATSAKPRQGKPKPNPLVENLRTEYASAVGHDREPGFVERPNAFPREVRSRQRE